MAKPSSSPLSNLCYKDRLVYWFELWTELWGNWFGNSVSKPIPFIGFFLCLSKWPLHPLNCSDPNPFTHTWSFSYTPYLIYFQVLLVFKIHPEGDYFSVFPPCDKWINCRRRPLCPFANPNVRPSTYCSYGALTERLIRKMDSAPHHLFSLCYCLVFALIQKERGQQKALKSLLGDSRSQGPTALSMGRT